MWVRPEACEEGRYARGLRLGQAVSQCRVLGAATAVVKYRTTPEKQNREASPRSANPYSRVLCLQREALKPSKGALNVQGVKRFC